MRRVRSSLVGLPFLDLELFFELDLELLSRGGPSFFLFEESFADDSCPKMDGIPCGQSGCDIGPSCTHTSKDNCVLKTGIYAADLVKYALNNAGHILVLGITVTETTLGGGK